MSNAKKRFYSERHNRRIIANKTNIDIAGCSSGILDRYVASPFDKFLNINVQNIGTENHEVNTFSSNKVMNINIKDTSLEDTYSINNMIQINKNNNDYCNTNNDDNDFNCIMKDTCSTADIENIPIRNALATWAILYNIPHNVCTALLKILRQYNIMSHYLPLDARTLLQTPKQSNNIVTLNEGEFVYLGLESIIKQMLAKNNELSINLLINIDGLLLSKSSNASLWPIL